MLQAPAALMARLWRNHGVRGQRATNPARVQFMDAYPVSACRGLVQLPQGHAMAAQIELGKVLALTAFEQIQRKHGVILRRGYVPAV
ncbi:hypothetical protein NBRC116187_32120 [Halopseudomonas sabulinigri]|uniref:Uncharacterized protein n=1 Tax=Halopseudomonas sabulinigri TaxID=472181 RepID=A0ABP9ZTR3_9GAMM